MTELEIFDEARKLFPGTKRGLEVEFDYFKNKHKKWKQILLLLKPAIERQIRWRKEIASRNYANPKFREFVPEWKHFQSWIYNSYWTLEFELPSESKAKKQFKPNTELPKVDLLSVPNYTFVEAKEQQLRRIKMRQDLLKVK